MTSKIVYFTQHGLALNKEDDAERPLSTEGISQTLAIARQLAQMQPPLSTIYHSGKLRAQQTAQIFSEQLSTAANKTSAHPHLSPNDDIQLLIPELQDKTLYVGHLPHLDKLCSYLLTGNHVTGMIHFRNSAVICLALNEDLCQLNWYITPEIITR